MKYSRRAKRIFKKIVNDYCDNVYELLHTSIWPEEEIKKLQIRGFGKKTAKEIENMRKELKRILL